MLRRNERTKQNEKRSLAFPKSILSLAISTWSAQHSSPMHGCAITRRSSKRRHQALDRSEHSTRDVSSDIIIVRLLGLLHSSLCNVVRKRRNEKRKKKKDTENKLRKGMIQSDGSVLHWLDSLKNTSLAHIQCPLSHVASIQQTGKGVLVGLYAHLQPTPEFSPPKVSWRPEKRLSFESRHPSTWLLQSASWQMGNASIGLRVIIDTCFVWIVSAKSRALESKFLGM